MIYYNVNTSVPASRADMSLHYKEDHSNHISKCGLYQVTSSSFQHCHTYFLVIFAHWKLGEKDMLQN